MEKDLQHSYNSNNTDRERRVDTMSRQAVTSVDRNSAAQPKPRASSWTLQIGNFDTQALGKLRTFLNFYTDAAELELQAIAYDDEHTIVRVAGEHDQANRLRSRLSEVYPAAQVRLEPRGG
ncbi:MAG: hypothetical protein U5L04_15980 [Trueperaceae bacterium]|nr:hypothetical protein [Trueperaceae bacterium]